MKLLEAAQFASLRDQGFRGRVPHDSKSGLELAKDIFAEAQEREQPFLYHTPQSWMRKWLASRKFTLVRMPLNAAAMPCEPKIDNLVLKKIHAMEDKPIIVDYNRNQVGRAMHGFVPQIIVIDGKHRYKAAALRGETHIMAWVGEVALETMHGAGGGGGGPKEMDPAPGARLVANAKEVDPAAGHRMVANTGPKQSARLADRVSTTYSAGRMRLQTLNVKRLMSEYKRDVSAGLFAASDIQAVAPPGCENMVKGLKDANVDNPFAVAWWHHNKYGGCGKEK